MPQELLDYELMRDMTWSWADLTGGTGGAPLYVQRFCLDFTGIRRRCEAERHARGQQQHSR